MSQSMILLISLPTVCAFIGWITNVIALKMLFRPHDPVDVLGLFKIQGVLPKHEKLFAEKFSRLTVSDFLTT